MFEVYQWYANKLTPTKWFWRFCETIASVKEHNLKLTLYNHNKNTDLMLIDFFVFKNIIFRKKYFIKNINDTMHIEEGMELWMHTKTF